MSMRRFAVPLMVIVLVVIVASSFMYWRATRGLITTDNAQTKGDLAPVSSRIPGTVITVNVAENQQVKAGAVLFELEHDDYALAVEHARAQLAAAHAQVQAARAALTAQEQEFTTGLSVARAAVQVSQPRLSQAETQVLMDEVSTIAKIDQARARVATSEAAVRAAKANLELVGRTLARNRDLLAQGAVAAQVIDSDTALFEDARARVQTAQEALNQAQAELVAAESARQQVAIQRQAVAVNKAEIRRAEALLQQAAGREALVRQRIQELAVAEARAADAASIVKIAEVNVDRTVIRAPSDGWVTNLTVQVGQVLQPNQPVMAIALARQVWVVANVKETLIGTVRIGAPVRIEVDAYPGRTFRGRVQSIGAATGASTALLPPDNATGNFVKIVQLVPVRIAIDPDTDAPPLRFGLSAVVTIDTRQGTR